MPECLCSADAVIAILIVVVALQLALYYKVTHKGAVYKLQPQPKTAAPTARDSIVYAPNEFTEPSPAITMSNV